MNKYVIFGAAGFIGTNLSLKLANEQPSHLILLDKKLEYFKHMEYYNNYCNVELRQSDFTCEEDYTKYLKENDIVYHLVSTTMPSNANLNISQELQANVVFTSKLLDACVQKKVKKVIFVSSGGTVYGKDVKCPINENNPTNPICSYGLQKLTIEKLLSIYKYIYGLDYVILRLANPFGPFQRPNGLLGAVTTFIYRILNNETINIYGDGNVIRDYVYIDDVVEAILKVTKNKCKYDIYNIGSGVGVSLNELIRYISSCLKITPNIVYGASRKADVPVNILDISRYENEFGNLSVTTFENGIKKTADFLNALKY